MHAQIKPSTWLNYKTHSPIMHMGFRTNRKRPQKPMYFERQPADQSLTMYSTPKNTTKHISIQNSVSMAKSLYCSMVDRTLNIKQMSTSINLWRNIDRKKKYIYENQNVNIYIILQMCVIKELLYGNDKCCLLSHKKHIHAQIHS